MNARHRNLVSLLAAFGMMALPHLDLRGQTQGQRDRAAPADNRRVDTPRADPSAPASPEDPFGGPGGKPPATIDPMDLKISYTSNTSASNVAAFVDAMIEASGRKLNIVVTPEASKVSLPNMTLENVKIRNALRLLSRIHPDLMIDEDNDAGNNDESRVILIDWNGSQEALFYRVIGVKDLLSTLDESKLMAAFDEGYQFINASGGKPEIRLHEPTGLLFVKGTEAQVNFAAEILTALFGTQGLSAPPLGYSGGMGSMGGGMGGMGGGMGGMGGGMGGMGMGGGISGAPPHGGAVRYGTSGGGGDYSGSSGAGGGSADGGGAPPGFGGFGGFGGGGSGGSPPSYPVGGGGSLGSGAGAPGNK